MDTIVIHELEVRCQVGVPDAERARPQRLIISLEMRTDFSAAAAADDLSKTVDYDAVVQYLKRLSSGRHWKLLETLAVEIAETILREHPVQAISVEIKKFIYSDVGHVGVRVERTANGPRFGASQTRIGLG